MALPMMMKAGSVAQNLAGLERHPRAREILAGVDPAALDSVRAAARTAWLPVAYDVALSRAAHRALGREAYWDLATRSVAAMVESPLIRPILEGFVRVFGPTPHSGFSLVPRAIQQVYRHHGRLEVDREGDSTAVLRW